MKRIIQFIASIGILERKSVRLGLVLCLMMSASCAWLIYFTQPVFAFPKGKIFTTEFFLDQFTFSSTGSNIYFILEPGFQADLAGWEGKTWVELTITVLEDTEQIGDIETRVVEEREWQDGELVEVSRNYFAIGNETSSVFYFGEDVDIYKGGVIVSHEGAWRAFSNGAEPGLIMPGTILLGSRYVQEIAPDVAMDRAEIVQMDATVKTPYGTFEDVLVTLETTPLEPSAKGYKYYAQGIGLVRDGTLELTNVVFP